VKKVLLFISVLAFLSGCVGTRPKGIKDCEFHLADVKTVEKALTYAKLQLELDVTNPNGVGVIIDRMQFSIYANGQQIGSGAASFKDNPIPPGESIKLKANVAVDYLSAGLAIFNMIKSQSASYSLGARVYYETPLGAYHSWTTISSFWLPIL
jgi:LEA14-like dessication related protein